MGQPTVIIHTYHKDGSIYSHNTHVPHRWVILQSLYTRTKQVGQPTVRIHTYHTDKSTHSNDTHVSNPYNVCADRFYWDSFDPQHMAEACFAVANIISFARLSFVLPANELFGPMQISLARMVTVSNSSIVFFLLVCRP